MTNSGPFYRGFGSDHASGGGVGEGRGEDRGTVGQG